MIKPKVSSGSKLPPFVPAFSALSGVIPEVPVDFPLPVTFRHKTNLVRQGDRPEWVGVVRSGIVKLSHSGESGRDVILGLRSQGWWINSQFVLLGLPTQYTVTAVTDCSVSMISTSRWNEKLRADQNLMDQVFYSQARELVMCQKLLVLRETSLEHRLSHMEDEAKHSIWKTLDPNSVLTQGELADLLAVSPEHLSRIKSKRVPLKRKSTVPSKK